MAFYEFKREDAFAFANFVGIKHLSVGITYISRFVRIAKEQQGIIKHLQST